MTRHGDPLAVVDDLGVGRGLGDGLGLDDIDPVRRDDDVVEVEALGWYIVEDAAAAFPQAVKELADGAFAVAPQLKSPDLPRGTMCKISHAVPTSAAAVNTQGWRGMSRQTANHSNSDRPEHDNRRIRRHCLLVDNP